MEVKQLLERELGISFSTKQNLRNDVYLGKYEGCTISIFHTGKVSVQGKEPKKSEVEKKIEKISAAIVLLTPDDIFASKKDYKEKGESCLQEQARQNVVLEMGMLMAKLGRDRVIILEKGDVKEPSDINGVFSLRFKDHARETLPTLVKRLRALGFGIDTDKALSILE